MIKVGELITKKASYLKRLREIPKKKLLKKIFDVCPNYSPALYSKARALSLRNKVQEGILLLERERERELQPGICDYYIAEILYEQKSYDQAMQFVERAISAEEEDANYHITKGEILRKIDKEFDGFISFMRGYNIHAINQEQGEKVKTAKLIMESDTFLDEKIELLEKIGMPNPSSSILYVLGHLYEKKENFEKADSAYKQFYDIGTSEDLLYANIGNRYHEWELFDEARTFYKRARELEPNKKKYMKLYANTFFVEHRYKLYLDEYRLWHQRIGSAKWRIKRDLIICKANMAMEDFFLRAEAKYRDAP